MSDVPKRGAKDYAYLYFSGLTMGAADVVPGVSGGTMAFIMGIYQELIDAIKSFDLDVVKLLVRFQVRGALEYFRTAAEEVAADITAQMGKPIRQAQREVVGLLERAEHMLDLAGEALAPDVLPAQKGVVRRIEHVLLDLRDTQKRLEDGIMRTIESGRAQATDTAGTSALVPAASAHSPISIGERVTNRLLAMGYERVQIITRAEKLVELASKDGEVMIEARRDGVLHKGRVLMRGGRMSDVELHPAYSIFP